MHIHNDRFLRILIPLIFSLGFLFLFFSSTSSWASNANSTQTSEAIPFEKAQASEDIRVVRVYYLTQDILNRIAARIEPWEVNKDLGYLIVDVDASEYDWLIKMGLRVEIDQILTKKIKSQRILSPDQVSGIPGEKFSCYKTVEETYAFAESLVITYPNLAEWIDIGDSWKKTQTGSLGYDLKVLKITNRNIDLPKPKLFIMASVHAREYAPAGLNTHFAKYLLENYGVDPDITWLLDYHEIHLLLQANPDGRKYAEAGNWWRKNTNENYCGAISYYRGADLNRNFSFKWNSCIDGNCSSSDGCDETYRGPSAASEPETQAIQNYLRAQFPDQRDDPVTSAAPITSTGVFIDLHSYGKQVLWPWGFTTDPAPNGDALQTLGRKFSYFNQYQPGQASNELYLTDGDSDGFAYGDLGLAGYTFEVGDVFFEECSSFQNYIIPDNIPALLYAAKTARFPYMSPSGPDIYNITALPNDVPSGYSIQIQATIDDSHYKNNIDATHFPEPTQIIYAAEYYIDTPPWITSTTPISFSMNVADGAFDEKNEIVTSSLSTTGLSQGKHIIFVRGQDAAGNWGPVTAQFFFIHDQHFFIPIIINP
jgi:carboxypeptidase T